MVCVKIRFSKKSYFMQINSPIYIANQLIGLFIIWGFTEKSFKQTLYAYM